MICRASSARSGAYKEGRQDKGKGSRKQGFYQWAADVPERGLLHYPLT